ncbi:MAG: pyrroloquinoline quinone precursor peptide PqqA, partial [Proteobacteria bacterium]|nr:pyrroloquinoline quinone precursor peptide PqqA [Pseudomonadota bacterium]
MRDSSDSIFLITYKRENIMWTKPEYSDMRFGFEVT